MNLEQLKYPIGKYTAPTIIDAQQIENWTKEIDNLPQQLRNVVENLTAQQLDTPYRPEGWTVRQVVHHLSDSHINAYVRFKLALTEENPSIRPYFEDRWAVLEDSKTASIEPSLLLLEALHQKWVMLINNCSEEQLKRTFYHPESKESTSIAFNIGNYAWHGKHHLTQITNLIKRMDW